MRQNLGENGLRAIFAEETGEVFLTLLKVSEPSLPEPLLAVNDTVDHTHNGELYTAYPFEPVLPNSDGETLPKTLVRISNVSPKLITILRKMASPVKVELKVVLASDIDVVKAEIKRLELKQITADVQVIDFTALSPVFLSAQWPAHGYSQDAYRALFR